MKRNDLMKMNMIITNIFDHGKLLFLLLILVLVSALSVVTVTYKTRNMTLHRENLLLEKERLDIEWRNFILEEKTLRNPIRLERIAIEQLNMQHIDPSQENILILIE